MGRKKANHVYEHFELNETTSKCLVCGKVVKGQHGTNLMKHLMVHADVFKIVVEKNQCVTEDDTPEASSSSKRRRTSNNMTTVLQECVNLTTVHGRPFTLIDDHAFQNIVSLIPGHSEESISAFKVKQSLTNTAAQLRRDLGKEVREKLICLKVDAATLGTRCFLGVNLQYAVNTDITVHNLGIIELYARHTGEYLADNVITSMQRCQIDIKQIYCCTTDNGANMIKMSKILGSKLKSSIHFVNESDEDTNESSDDDTDEIDINVIDPEAFQKDLENALAVRLTEGDLNVPPVRCAAHTLQLAIRDACTDTETEDLIKLVRQLVKKLRSPNYSMFLRAANQRKPILDCATRWGSTYDMVERFILLKDILRTDSSNDLYFPAEKWSLLDDYIKSLKPSRILTKTLQAEQMTMSDFYGQWLKCELDTNDVNTVLSSKLVTHMRERQRDLFNNEAFVSAIYLDPRFNTILTQEQQISARAHLIKTYRRMMALKETDNLSIGPTSSVSDDLNCSTTSSTSNANNAISGSQSALDKVREYLSAKYTEKHDPSAPTSVLSLIDRLSDEMINFVNEPLLDFEENIMLYWKTKRSRYPALYELSQIVLSAPATQVSVERLFSSLKFVLSNLRMSMKDHRVEDILFVRNNSQRTEKK